MPKIYSVLVPVLLSLFLYPLAGLAEDKIELRTTTIKGNKELPKILYLVPWKCFIVYLVIYLILYCPIRKIALIS